MRNPLVNANRVDMVVDGIKAQMDFGPLKRRPLSLSLSFHLSLSGFLLRVTSVRPTTANVVFPAEEIALSADKSEREIERAGDALEGGSVQMMALKFWDF